MITRLFVYGTLLSRTYCQHSWQKIGSIINISCKPLERAFIFGRLFDLGRYPAATSSDSHYHKIFGAIVVIKQPKQAFHCLDKFENYDSNYESSSEFLRRQVTAFRIPNLNPVTCWVYYYNKTVTYRPIIQTGDYIRHLRLRQK